jgi:outer membrane lipase/esterase
LRYSGLDQNSAQSSVGAAASVEVAIPGGKLWPQLSAAWVHEYANNARQIDASFVDASPTETFTFQREKPARDWANIGLGVSAALRNGQLRPFAQFTTVQGNENFVSYGGTAGLRVSF